MKISRRTFSSRLLALLYQLRFYGNPKEFGRFLFISYWRKTCAQHNILGIPVYVWNSHRDVSFGPQMVEQALRLLSQTSPCSMRQIGEQISCIIIVPGGGRRVLSHAGRCCIINPFGYLPKAPGSLKSKNRQFLLLVGDLASAAQELRLFKGRFGHFGIQHSLYLRIKTEIRALRRCFSTDMQLEALSVVAGGYKLLDQQGSHPIRRYHPAFIEREMEKWSFGKKLQLHPECDTLVVEEKT